MKKKYQVFVSSTYEDLKEERAAVMEVLLDNDCIPVGMEQFPASDMSQMTYIEKILEDSDYYVLILAGRYGSVDSDGIGFTEKEYNFAISKRIPVLSFVCKDIGELPTSKCEETDNNRALLYRFREKVCENKQVKFYQNSSELKSQVATSINHAKADFPATGWVRGTGSLYEKDLTMKCEMKSLSATTGVYCCEGDYGSFTFDYSNNNGEFTIGKNEYLFTTKWSKASNKAIHAYSDHPNIDSIARIKAPFELSKELNGEFDFSSRVRTPNIGDGIIWKNNHGKYALTKITSIKDDSRGVNEDELTCEYIIYR